MSHEHFNYGDASYSEGSSDSDKGNPDKKHIAKDRSGGQRYISNACRNCRALHRRCDGRPNCNNCKKRGIVCEYGEPTKRGPKSRKAQGDENYRDQSSKRAKHRRVVHNNMVQNNSTQLYSNKNPFAESKQDSAAELSEPFEVLDARILNQDYSGSHAPYYAPYDSSPDRPLLDAAWSDLLQTWAVPVPSLATHLPHPLTGAHTTQHSGPSLPTSTLHLLTAENLRDLLPLYQPQLLAAHAYRGVLLAFGFMVQNQRNQAAQMMNAAHGVINFVRALGHTAMLDLTILLATAQIFGALFYINEGKSEFAARLVEEALFTCQSFNGSARIPVNLWQKTYVLRAALEDKDQALWEGYSWQIIEDKSDPGSERPYDLLTHIVLVFLVTTNAFKDAPSFNLPHEPAALHARMGVLKQLEGYVKSMPANAHYQRQISLASFFLYSTMALVYLQYIRLHEIAQDEGYRHVQECLTEAREQLTRVMPVKCCPALALAISLDISIVKKLHEHGKEVPQTLEAWALLHTCHSPLVEEREKYPDNYGKPLHKLFESGAEHRELPAPKQYGTSYYQPQPQFYPPTSVAPSAAQPPKSLAGYTTDQSYRTTDQSYRNTPWSFNEHYSKTIVGQYQQYTRPNYSAQPANNSTAQPQQYPSPNMGKHSPSMSQYASHSFSDHSH